MLRGENEPKTNVNNNFLPPNFTLIEFFVNKRVWNPN